MVRINKIVEKSYVDGPGERAVIFFQGCPIHCKGCQNVALWNADGGLMYDEEQLAQKVAAYGRQVTISGGEPFAQVGLLAKLVYYLKKYGVEHIIIYSGYTWETILNPLNGLLPWVRTILEVIDVLVDGRFVASLDDPFIVYRGSRNQRPIDVPESLCEGKVITLDWDEPEIVLTPEVNPLMPVGLAVDMADLGASADTAMCGQTRR
jgi:anaerobic ribonucleoside-triphosphate reductase activating protein